MTSDKQVEANRQNSQLGGVKTEEGKAVSRYNALRHGLLAKEVLMEGEDEVELEELGKTLRAELKPASALELVLVDRIIANTWRLKRALRIEREMIEADTVKSLFDKNKPIGEALAGEFRHQDTYGKFARYDASIERGLFRALHELQRLQAARNGNQPLPPVVVDFTGI